MCRPTLLFFLFILFREHWLKKHQTQKNKSYVVVGNPFEFARHFCKARPMVQEWLFDSRTWHFALPVEHGATCIGVLNLTSISYGVWLVLRRGLLWLDMLSEWHFIGLEACLGLAVCVRLWLPLRVDPRCILLSTVTTRPLAGVMV